MLMAAVPTFLEAKVARPPCWCSDLATAWQHLLAIELRWLLACQPAFVAHAPASLALCSPQQIPARQGASQPASP